MPLRGSVRPSFAYRTIKDRLPVILTKCVDEISRHIHAMTLPGSNVEEDVVNRGKFLINEIGRLRYELQRDRLIQPLEPTGVVEEDVDLLAWNAVLDLFRPPFTHASNSHMNAIIDGKDGPRWFQAPWLLVECFMYRALHDLCVRAGDYWSHYDPFRSQKRSSFLASHLAVFSLAHRAQKLHNDILELRDVKMDEQMQHERSEVFSELVHMSLWGNATDLSLLVDLKLADIHELQSKNNAASRDHFTIVDETSVLWNHVKALKNARVDICMDNSGFELFGDLILADWLLSAGYAKTVHLHFKRIPWFVSDSTLNDLNWLLDVCQGLSTQTFTDKMVDQLPVDLLALTARLRRHISAKSIIPEIHPFWTLPHAYYHLEELAIDLHNMLFHQSDVVIFKGDLHYRKLVYDCQWEPEIPFIEAIGPVWKGMRGMLCALRTCKADVVVGLESGKAATLTTQDKEWMVNGKYGVIHACKP